MRPINKKAQAVMNRLTVGLDAKNSHRKIDNNPPDSGIMAVSVDWMAECQAGDILNVAHYYEQNGDMMADPEIVFLRAADGRYYPMSWRMDGLGIYREGVVFEDGEPAKIDVREQREEAIFAGEWMQNIKMQQFRRR